MDIFVYKLSLFTLSLGTEIVLVVMNRIIYIQPTAQPVIQSINFVKLLHLADVFIQMCLSTGSGLERGVLTGERCPNWREVS